MLSDKKFGLTHNLIATKVMPPLIPYTVSPGLNMEQVRSSTVAPMTPKLMCGSPSSMFYV